MAPPLTGSSVIRAYASRFEQAEAKFQAARDGGVEHRVEYGKPEYGIVCERDEVGEAYEAVGEAYEAPRLADWRISDAQP